MKVSWQIENSANLQLNSNCRWEFEEIVPIFTYSKENLLKGYHNLDLIVVSQQYLIGMRNSLDLVVSSHQITSKFVWIIIFVVIITGCGTGSKASDNSRANITQLEQSIINDGFGEYNYLYTNEKPGIVKLWLVILENGKSVNFENTEELVLRQEHNANYKAELGLNLNPDENGNLLWQFRFGNDQKVFSTENYTSDCMTRNYSVSSDANWVPLLNTERAAAW